MSESEAPDLSVFPDALGDAQPGPGNLTRSVQLRVKPEDLGRADSLRHTILTLVAQEEYDRASKRLIEFLESKKEYPQFQKRAGRYLSYATDLINGIRAKRSFPGVQTLAMAKQQELYDKAMSHFNDLTATLRKIEQIDVEVRAEDSRSTIWIVKAVVYGVCAVLLVAFLREVSRGVVPTAGVVLDDLLNRFANLIFGALGI